MGGIWCHLLTGEITRVDQDRGVFVKLSSYVSAEVPLEQLTNVPVKTIGPKYKPGAKIKLRVMQVFPHLNKVKCTAKKDLVKAPEDEILTSLEDAKMRNCL